MRSNLTPAIDGYAKASSATTAAIPTSINRSLLPCMPGSLAIGRDESPKAFVILPSGGAAFQVGAQARQAGVRVGAGELQLDVLIEQLEALLAGDLEAG